MSARQLSPWATELRPWGHDRSWLSERGQYTASSATTVLLYDLHTFVLPAVAQRVIGVPLVFFGFPPRHI